MDRRSRSAEPDAAARKPRRDDELEVEIEGLDERGRAFGRARHPTGEYRVRLRRGLPGELVRAKVLRRRRDVVDAVPLAVLRANASRVAPRCAHFGPCGGCSLQDLDYAAQLEEKRRMLERLFAHLGTAVDAVIGSREPWRHRNKMDFTFGTRRWVLPDEPENVSRDFALGLHPREQFRKLLSIDTCWLQDERCDAILRDARRLAQERGLSAWDLERHEGLLRHLVLRTSRATGEILVQLVTSAEAPELVRPYADALLALHPEISTLVQTISTRLAVVAAGERELVLHGPGAIRERLAGLWFAISAASFFQTNPAQAEELVGVVLSECDLRPDDSVLDLYCGAGALSLPIARVARSAHGVELGEAAIADARRNAATNGITNATFEAEDVHPWLARHASDGFDVLVVDPPRAGLHPSVAPRLATSSARRIVYVSCNPRAAVRDVEMLLAQGWKLARIRPLDLFPHAPHVECVLTLVRGA